MGDIWRKFEERHGNVDTFREMLRIRRSVQAQYSTQVNFVISQQPNESEASELGKRSRSAADAMEQLENRFPTTNEVSQAVASPEPVEETTIVNEEEIDIGDDDDDSDEETTDVIEQKPIPKAVFGSAIPESYENRKTD